MSSKNFYGLTGDVTIDGGILNVGNAQLYANTETSNVGIGTTNPGFTLDVNGDANVGVLYSTFLHGDGSNIENIVSSQWEGSPGNPIYYTSNVGISNTEVVTKTLQIGSNLFVEETGSNVLYVTGNVYASRFVGDGSLLTGIAASLDDIVDQGNVVSNTIILESGIDPVSNIGLVTKEGVAISISNVNPTGEFQLGVGSNLLVNVYSSNVLTVDGNVFAQKMTLGTVTVTPSYNLEQITTTGATSGQSMSLTNATTGLTTTANIVVGGNVTATSVIITSNIEVGGNVNANTVITTANIEVGGNVNANTVITTANIEVGGNAQLQGGVALGGHIIPTVDNTYDIGSAAFKIRDMYVSDNSLWIGDDTKLSVTGGELKFRKRNTGVVPKGITDMGGTSGAALTHGGVSDINDMKLHHWEAYAKSIDATKTTKDIFTDDADNYETSAIKTFHTSNAMTIGTTKTFVAVCTADASGAKKYYIDGYLQASLVLHQGQTYIFDLSSPTLVDHPFVFQTTNANDGTTDGTNYTSGITTTGAYGSTEKRTFIVPAGAPTTLYYFCTAHAGMGATVSISPTAELMVSGRIVTTDLQVSGTGGATLGSGTTAQRSVYPLLGTIRYNSTTGYMEAYTASGWGSIAQPPTITGISPLTTLTSGGTLAGWDAGTKIMASDLQASDQFGGSVSMSSDGTKVIVGVKYEDTGASNAGSAYIFALSGGSWSQEAKIQASDPEASDYFGYSVSMSGDGTKVIVGAYGEDTGGSQAGAAYIFALSGGSWSQQQKIQASDAQTSDLFGYGVSMSSDGTKVLVGARNEDTGASNAGSAYIFALSGGSWSQEAKIQASDKQAGDDFGQSVAMNSDGTKVLVGAYYEDTGGSNAGAAYIFALSGGSWSQEAKIQASDPEASDNFGYSVSMSGDGTKVLVGARGEDTGGTNAGKAYIYTYSSGSWGSELMFQSSDIQVDDNFGQSVAMSSDGTKVVVGAYAEDTGATNAGAAYIFDYHANQIFDSSTQVFTATGTGIVSGSTVQLEGADGSLYSVVDATAAGTQVTFKMGTLGASGGYAVAQQPYKLKVSSTSGLIVTSTAAIGFAVGWTSPAANANLEFDISASETETLVGTDGGGGTNRTFSLAPGSNALPSPLVLTGSTGAITGQIAANQDGVTTSVTFRLTDNATGLFTDRAIDIMGSSELYAFTSHTFTNAGKTGQDGPTLSQLTTAYSPTWTDYTSNLNVTTQGIQEWTVPKTGEYTIKAAGAGIVTASGDFGGVGRAFQGIEMQGTFTLTRGATVRIIVGQSGTHGYGNSPGGSGGTYVFYNATDTYPIMVAGGGGGFYPPSVRTNGIGTNTYLNSCGQSGTSGGSNSAGNNSQPGGTSGSGGLSQGAYAGGGAGWLTDGGDAVSVASSGGHAPRNTGAPGRGGNDASNGHTGFGGFGGGGGVHGNTGGAGAGGGYSGGRGWGQSTGQSGGGGSYGGTATNVYNASQGWCIITQN